MEKGNSKPTTKSNNTDSKNKADVLNKHLRLPRGKDGVSPRPEVRRKPNPQRNKELFDKRPRNRTGAFYEKYRSEITDGAVGESTKHGKTNLNHLLNFTVRTPTDHYWDRSDCRPARNRFKLPKYNKELFLQASCQFVARDNEDYIVHQKNPDILVEWSRIEEIRFPCHEIPLCPICLYAPVAAKITRCGHIYCWPCMLHYLSLTDKSWQKCPICFEAVHQKDLKSVSMRIKSLFSVGSKICLNLMKREKGSLLAMPVTEQKLLNSMCTVRDVDPIVRYQKLLLASSKEVKLIINNERFELTDAYQREKEAPEVCFIEQAIELLNEREHNLTHPIPKDTEADAEEKNINAFGRKQQNSISSTDSLEEYLDINDNDKFGSPPTAATLQAGGNEPDSKGLSFFYQAEDGQHIYLHNLNVRMLIKEYGSLEFGPPQINAKIVAIESVTMTEILRKKLRYLQHLPLTCEFQFVELDFVNLVSESTYMEFQKDIVQRKNLRYKKACKEIRREQKIEEEENRKLGKYPKAVFNLKSNDQFPVFKPEEFLSLPPKNEIRDQRTDVNSNVYGGCTSSPPDSDTSPSDISSGPSTSFAQMLKDGPKAFGCSPVPEKNPSHQPLPQDDYEDDEECSAAPEYRQTFGDAIQAALDAMTLNESMDAKPTSKKKKKGKKQLLFTTSMCRTK